MTIASVELKKIYGKFCYNFFGSYSPRILKVTYEISFRCNLKCATCFFWRDDAWKKTLNKVASGKELDTAGAIAAINNIARSGARAVTITGGEPFIRKDINQIIEHLGKTGLSTTIATNGTLLSKSHAKQLVESRINTLSFSVDGPEAINDRIRGKNVYLRLRQAVRSVMHAKASLASKYPRITMNTTISALNLDELEKIIDVACDLGIGNFSIHHTMFVNPDAIKKSPDWIYLPKDFKLSETLINNRAQTEKLKEKIELIRKRARKMGVRVEFFPDLKGEEIEKYYLDADYSFRDRCYYPWVETRISPSGDIYACDMGFKAGNILEDELRNVWNGKKYRQFRSALKNAKLFPFCRKCCKISVW